jgi:hypothetical protein
MTGQLARIVKDRPTNRLPVVDRPVKVIVAGLLPAAAQ